MCPVHVHNFQSNARPPQHICEFDCCSDVSKPDKRYRDDLFMIAEGGNGHLGAISKHWKFVADQNTYSSSCESSGTKFVPESTSPTAHEPATFSDHDNPSRISRPGSALCAAGHQIKFGSHGAAYINVLGEDLQSVPQAVERARSNWELTMTRRLIILCFTLSKACRRPQVPKWLEKIDFTKDDDVGNTEEEIAPENDDECTFGWYLENMVAYSLTMCEARSLRGVDAD